MKHLAQASAIMGNTSRRSVGFRASGFFRFAEIQYEKAFHATPTSPIDSSTPDLFLGGFCGWDSTHRRTDAPTHPRTPECAHISLPLNPFS